MLCDSSQKSTLRICLFIPILPFILHPFFHSATWKADVMAGVLVTILDHEDKNNTSEMVRWLAEACVPEELEK